MLAIVIWISIGSLRTGMIIERLIVGAMCNASGWKLQAYSNTYTTRQCPFSEGMTNRLDGRPTHPSNTSSSRL